MLRRPIMHINKDLVKGCGSHLKSLGVEGGGFTRNQNVEGWDGRVGGGV